MKQDHSDYFAEIHKISLRSILLVISWDSISSRFSVLDSVSQLFRWQKSVEIRSFFMTATYTDSKKVLRMVKKSVMADCQFSILPKMKCTPGLSRNLHDLAMGTMAGGPLGKYHEMREMVVLWSFSCDCEQFWISEKLRKSLLGTDWEEKRFDNCGGKCEKTKMTAIGTNFRLTQHEGSQDEDRDE